jgi:hypothetical protein
MKRDSNFSPLLAEVDSAALTPFVCQGPCGQAGRLLLGAGSAVASASCRRAWALGSTVRATGPGCAWGP